MILKWCRKLTNRRTEVFQLARRSGRSRALLGILALEDRCLLSSLVTTFRLPDPSAVANAIIAGPDANIWFTETAAGRVGRITPGGVIQDFDLSMGSSPAGIAVGSDGNLWITDNGTNGIDRLTPTGVLTEFRLPPGYGTPSSIAATHNGDLWFTETNRAKLGRLTVTGQFSEIGLGDFAPANVVSATDDSLWLIDAIHGRVGRYSATGLSTFSLPATTSSWGTINETLVGPDGSLWFTQAAGANHVGRITTAGVVSYFQLQVGQTPSTLAFDSAGNLWFAGSGALGMINVSIGIVTEYAVGANLTGQFTFGSDGNLWFAGSDGILRVNLSGLPATTFNELRVDGNLTIVFVNVTVASTLPVSGLGGSSEPFFAAIILNQAHQFVTGFFYVTPGLDIAISLSPFALVSKGAVASSPGNSSNPGTSGVGSSKSPDLILYDATVRITWQSLTVHGASSDQATFVTPGGVSSGGGPRDNLSVLSLSRSSGFAGQANSDAMGTSKGDSDTTPFESKSNDLPCTLPKIDEHNEEHGQSSSRARKTVLNRDADGSTTPPGQTEQRNSRDTAQPEQVAILVSTRGGLAPAPMADRTRPYNAVTMRRRSSRGSGTAVMPQGPAGLPISSDGVIGESDGTPRPDSRDLIAVADAILEKNGQTKDERRTLMSQFVGPLFRVVITFLLFQPVFWGMASQTNNRDNLGEDSRKPEL
jgi:virginiamycin B lyase